MFNFLSDELVAEAICRGYSLELLEDLNQTILSNPRYREWKSGIGLAEVEEYKEDVDSEYGAQVRWDASFRHTTVFPR